MRHPVYVYFNNDGHGCAIRDVLRLMALTQSGQEKAKATEAVA